MVQLATAPVSNATPEPFVPVVTEDVCPLPPELGTYVTLRTARFDDGLWRFGALMGSTFSDAKIDKQPIVGKDEQAFETQEQATEACLQHCVALWKMLPNDQRIVDTIAFLLGTGNDADDEEWETVEEDELPAAEATAEAAPEVVAAEVPALELDPACEAWADTKDFTALTVIRVPLRDSLRECVAAVRIGLGGDNWHYAVEIDASTMNKGRVFNKLTKDSPSCETPQEAEAAGLAELLKTVQPIDMRLAIDVTTFLNAAAADEIDRFDPKVFTYYGVKHGSSEDAAAIAAAPDGEVIAMETAEQAAVAQGLIEPVAEPVVEQAVETPPPVVAVTPPVKARKTHAEKLAEYEQELQRAEQRVARASAYVEEMNNERKSAKESLKEATSYYIELERRGPPWPEAEKPIFAPAAEVVVEAAATPTATLTLGGEQVEVKVDQPTTAAAGDWQSLSFDVLAMHGLKPGIIEICAENPPMPIKTLGDWTTWCGKYQPTEIARIGQAKADAIADAFEKFWAANPAYTR